MNSPRFVDLLGLLILLPFNSSARTTCFFHSLITSSQPVPTTPQVPSQPGLPSFYRGPAAAPRGPPQAHRGKIFPPPAAAGLRPTPLAEWRHKQLGRPYPDRKPEHASCDLANAFVRKNTKAAVRWRVRDHPNLSFHPPTRCLLRTKLGLLTKR